jgi:hypothetical protein
MITPESLEQIGLRRREVTHGLLDIETPYKWLEKQGISLRYTFYTDDGRGKLKKPKFAWLEINGGRLWQKGGGRKSQWTPTIEQTIALLKALGVTDDDLRTR